MAKGINRLSAKAVEAAKIPGYYMDGGGLFMRVSENGGKRWLFRYTLPGQPRREMGLGAAGAGGVSLKIAREKAQDAREMVQRGLDPIQEIKRQADEERQAREIEAKAASFGAYVGDYLKAKLPQYRNAKHRYQWRQSLETYAAPIWDKKLESITRDDILALLQPIWDEKHITATRFRGRLERVFDHAIQNRAFRGDNPARWSLFNATLSSPRKQEGRGPLAAMPRSRLPEFIKALRERQKTSMGALALEFTILGANRSGEVRLARWGEIDLDLELWNIPGERMKVKMRNGRTYVHSVILTRRMIEILQIAYSRQCAMRGITKLEPDALIFQSNTEGKELSDMTLRAVMRRMGVGQYTVHGFRSTFRDWAGSDTDFARELAEEALAHTLPDVERSYRREQAIKKRRLMMEAWEAFCEGRGTQFEGNVTVLNARV
ncbi:tyrosine-type recombinase/integrase [Oricola nitratireducens]|uniref:tyrosine-type recombinase/integrase n=1 Tax=Oricola nitratireducens TaxID=2775868 RepID=UPI0018683B5E|nr:site-specific integrase [Oricola nitratireducens]